MELKWLEDFVVVAEKGHFARAAAERFITQSALSRRIQSLEAWVGATLFDRSEHPIKLTAAGKEFMVFSREIINKAYEGRSVTQQFFEKDTSNISIGCLHTLTLSYLPNFIKDMQKHVGPFLTTITADSSTFEEYLTALYDGSCDFFMCYENSAFSLGVDETYFPKILLGRHYVRPYQGLDLPRFDLSAQGTGPIPYVEYSPHTYMIRPVEQSLQNAPFKKRLQTCYRASIAESLFTATQNGLGVAWLPDAIVADPPEKSGLQCLSKEWSFSLDICLYKSARNQSVLVDKIWQTLEEGLK